MVTTAVPDCRPHEVRPARGNASCGWLPSGFYSGSLIQSLPGKRTRPHRARIFQEDQYLPDVRIAASALGAWLPQIFWSQKLIRGGKAPEDE